MNVDIPLNRQKFIDHFHSILDEKYSFKKKYNKQNIENEAHFLVKDSSNKMLHSSEMMKLGEAETELDSATKLILDIDLSIEKP